MKYTHVYTSIHEVKTHTRTYLSGFTTARVPADHDDLVSGYGPDYFSLLV